MLCIGCARSHLQTERNLNKLLVRSPRETQGGARAKREPLSGPMSDTIRTADKVFIEWDRKLIWVATESGLYVLSSPALGKPVLSPMPVREWTLPSINKGWQKFKPALG